MSSAAGERHPSRFRLSTPGREAFSLFRAAGARWLSDRCDRLGAALAYYAMFSFFPLLLLSITALGYALGNDTSMRERLIDSVATMAGSAEVRSLLDDTLTSMEQHRTARGVGAVIGGLSLIFSASGVFSELSSSINTIWRVKEAEPSTFRGQVRVFLRSHVAAVVIVGATGLTLLASLALGTAVTAMKNAGAMPWIWGPAEFVASTLLLGAALAAMFRILPQTRVAWADVAWGALVAALALSVLRRLLAVYLAHIGNYAAYGVVGGILGLMLLVYLSSLVVFFGAEFARVFADRRAQRRLEHGSAGASTGGASAGGAS